MARMVDLPTGIGRTTYTLCLPVPSQSAVWRETPNACWPAFLWLERGGAEGKAETGQEVCRRFLLHTADKGVAQLIDTLPAVSVEV